MAISTDTTSTQITSDTGITLMRRAPTGYLWNQAGAIWLFVSLLLFEVVVRRTLPKAETNAFDLVSTVANLAFYVASFGLTTSGTVYLPRTLVEHGVGPARTLTLRLVLMRLLLAVLVGATVVWALPALASGVAASGWSFGIQLTQSYTVTELIQYRTVIAAYVVAVGMSTLLSSLLIALVRTRVVFIFGSLGQLLQLVLGVPPHSHPRRRSEWRSSGAIAVGDVYRRHIRRCTLAPACGVQFVHCRRCRFCDATPDVLGPNAPTECRRLALRPAQLIAGTAPRDWPVGGGSSGRAAVLQKHVPDGGCGRALLYRRSGRGKSGYYVGTAYAGEHLPPLATGWRTVSKLQVLLALPVVVFAVPHASAIMSLLFGPLYAQSGYLLAVFLILNGLTQLLGGSTHQWALYVLGQQRWVVVSQWATVGILAVTGAVLVPRYFALGALLAVGIGRLAAQVFLFVLARISVHRPYPVAFSAKLLLALVLPAAATVIWQPAPLVAGAISRLRWLPAASSLVVQQGLVLAIQTIVFLLIFLVCLRVIRPLDAEDAALLDRVPQWLRRILMPLVNRKTLISAKGGTER